MAKKASAPPRRRRSPARRASRRPSGRLRRAVRSRSPKGISIGQAALLVGVGSAAGIGIAELAGARVAAAANEATGQDLEPVQWGLIAVAAPVVIGVFAPRLAARARARLKAMGLRA